MKKTSKILLGVVICLAVIGISYFWAMGLMDSVYTYRSPLHDAPPVPGQPLGSPNTRSVVMVLVDGLRYDTSLKTDVMPYLNQLRNAGASALMHSRAPSYSIASYTTLLTGAWSDINDGPIITMPYDEIPTFTQDDIFSAAHRARLSTAISGFNWFEKLVPQSAVTASFYTPGEDQAADRQVIDAALPWLRQGNDGLVLIHLDQVDYAGHYEGGPTDPHWDAAATRVDGLIEEIATAMNLRQDTLIVLSDHGHINQGGHGGQDAIILMEPFIMAGNGVEPGIYNDIQMVDVAPTVAALLGTNIPATNQGHVHYEMFDFSLTQVDDIRAALKVQQTQLAQIYQDAIGQPVLIQPSSDSVAATQAAMDAARETRLNSDRILRGVFGIIFIILAINLTAWGARPHYKWMIAGVVSYLVVFNIKYLLVDHKTYSLSSATDPSSLIAGLVMNAGIALFVGWLLFLLGTRAYRFKPRKAADTTMRFILVTLSILAIPIAVHFALNGPVLTWTLPDYLISFLGLLFLIQTLMVAAMGLFLTGFTALVGMFGNQSSY
jgi:Type I phosphodiesterase / nucleotide pyrophosphatase